MVKENRISVRVGPAHNQVTAIAATLTTDAIRVTTSDAYRTLLAEAVSARIHDCSSPAGHKGPIKTGVCGHCGRPTR